MKSVQLLAASACLLSASTSFAAPTDGFYLGGGVGVSTFDERLDTSIDFSGVNLVSVSSEKGATGFAGTIFLGYGHTFDRFFMGGEFSVDATTAEIGLSDNLGGTINETFPFSLSLSLKPGYLINPFTLIYGKVGYKLTRFETDLGGTKALGAETPLYGFPFNDESYMHGLLLGLGLEAFLTEKLSTSFEYNFTIYHAHDLSSTGIPSQPSTAVGSYDYRTYENSFYVKLTYHFNDTKDHDVAPVPSWCKPGMMCDYMARGKRGITWPSE